MADITIVNGVYKPTYNWGAPSCSKPCLIAGGNASNTLDNSRVVRQDQQLNDYPPGCPFPNGGHWSWVSDPW